MSINYIQLYIIIYTIHTVVLLHAAGVNSAYHQPGQRYQTAMFSTTSAADTDAVHRPRWYEPTIRMAAGRGSLATSYTSITAAAGMHHPHHHHR